MFTAYQTDSITLKQFKGSDKYGEPSTRTSISLKCRIDRKNRQVNDVSGRTVVSSAKIQMTPRTIIRSGFLIRDLDTIAYEDIINFDSTDHAIIQISKEQDFSVRLIEVYVQ